MTKATLTINSRNYGAWSLRGWLLCRTAGLDFTERVIPSDDPSMRAELLALSPSFLVPKLEHEDITVWDTLAIAEYLNETFPAAGLLPGDRKARAHCRAVCGEIHSGFSNLRSALPMNLRARYADFKVWAGAQADIARISTLWLECLAAYGGPYLFGKLSIADAMFAPECTRFTTYDVTLDPACKAYCERVLALPPMQEWYLAAQGEPDDLEELDAEF